MVTTLIAQIVRFARPNIQIYDAHVLDLYQWVCARYLVGVKDAETKASAVKLGSRPNFRKDLAFQTLSRPEAIRGSTVENRDLPYISIGNGGESVSQSQLMQKLLFHSST